ncbi:hypothetical protein PENTCL1PPCAC_8291, partial [Pristionchus entomophagus]
MADLPEFWTRTRFIVMVLLLLCLSSIWSNILAFNFAVICMAPQPNETSTDRFQFSDCEFLKNTLLTSIVALAALLANFPLVHAVNKAGIRSIFAVLGIISGAATLAIPASIRVCDLPYSYLLACRFLQGLGFAAIFPVVGAFSAKWTYHKQTGLFVSVLVSYVQLSPAITMPVSGALCTHAGWPSVFYVHGSVSLVLFVAYAALYRNSPSKHPFVGARECTKISIGKTTVDKTVLRRIPYRAILTTPAIWAVWLGAVGNFAAVNLMFLYNPVYFSKVLGLTPSQTGAAAAVPPFVQFFVKLACGAASDRITSVSEQTKYRTFNSVAFLGCATCFGALAMIDAETKALNLFLLLGAAGILGAVTGGFYKAAPALSKQYSHFVTGNISVVLTATMMGVPLLVNSLTTHDATHDEWRAVFGIVAAILVRGVATVSISSVLVSNVIFCGFVRGEPCEWTKDDWIQRNSV